MTPSTSRLSGAPLFAISLACGSAAHAFDVEGFFPQFVADTPPATTTFTTDGQSETWLGTVNSFFALSKDPGAVDPSDVWTFTVGAGLLGSFDVTARSGAVRAGTFLNDGFGVQLTGPVAGVGSGGLALAGLTPGSYTATFTNNAGNDFPAIAGYTMTVSVATAVPEPSSWARLLVGAGLVGLRGWRPKQLCARSEQAGRGSR